MKKRATQQRGPGALRAGYYHWRVKFLEAGYSRLPTRGVTRPVFILGSARSGKSTLAGLLSRHPEIVDLNEPRHFWCSAFPESDIWSHRAAERRGRINLEAADFRRAGGRRLSRLYRLRAIRSGGSIVVEDQDVNSFRVPLLRRIFPEARFIHVYRNGLDVAELIEQAYRLRGTWYGHNFYKWKQLSAYAARWTETRGLSALCKSIQDMALLEWRLNTEAAAAALRELPDESYIEINSNELFDDPKNVLARVFQLIGLADEATIAQPTAARSSNQNTASRLDSAAELSYKSRLLGGPMLLSSLQPCWKPMSV